MRKTWFTVLLAIALVALGSSQVSAGWFDKIAGIKGSGQEMSETRELAPFNEIELESSADIFVTIGEVQSVTVTTDDNLLDNLKTRVTGSGKLIIDTRKSYRSRIGVRIDIVMPALEAIEVQGSGDIQVFDLDGERLEIDIQGSGDVEIEGRVNELYIDIQGSGDVSARRLEARDVEIDIDGSGDVAVMALTSFDGKINGSGDIRYYGNPEYVSTSINGSGTIRRR